MQQFVLCVHFIHLWEGLKLLYGRMLFRYDVSDVYAYKTLHFKLFFMFLSSFSILVAGTLKAGGFKEVFDRNYNDGRIQLLNLDPDVRERHTLWGTTLGAGLIWLNIFGVSQMQIQRWDTYNHICYILCFSDIFACQL